MVRVGYLTIMTSVIAVIAAISVPSLFWPRCAACGRRNWVARQRCRHCGKTLPDELES